MSRAITKTALDREWWWPAAGEPPEWLQDRLEDLRNATGPDTSLDKETREYLVSRARYVTSLDDDCYEDGIRTMVVVDEMLRHDANAYSLRLLYSHEMYPVGVIRLKKDGKSPSTKTRLKASLLYAHFKNLKDTAAEEQRVSCPSDDDLLAILKIWSVQPNEKLALAQRLLIEHPRGSQTAIADLSANHRGNKFDQSCLSQWIIAGWVMDPYTFLRPDGPLGTNRNRPPKGRPASSADRPG